MSAYVVSNKTINQVLTWLNANSHRSSAGHSLRQAGYELNDTDDLQRLCEALFNLNCDAVSQRYPEDAPAEREINGKSVYQFNFAPCMAVQAYKSAKCLYYQCLEGKVTATELYSLLFKTIAEIADEIIIHSPEYNRAAWQS